MADNQKSWRQRAYEWADARSEKLGYGLIATILGTMTVAAILELFYPQNPAVNKPNPTAKTPVAPPVVPEAPIKNPLEETVEFLKGICTDLGYDFNYRGEDFYIYYDKREPRKLINFTLDVKTGKILGLGGWPGIEDERSADIIIRTESGRGDGAIHESNANIHEEIQELFRKKLPQEKYLRLKELWKESMQKCSKREGFELK